MASLEPVVLSLIDEREQAMLGAAVARVGGLAAEGRFADAARAFAVWPFNDEEIAVAEQAGYFEAAGRYAPNLLNLLRQSMEYEGPTADDPAVLGAISAPVAVLHGSHTRPFLIASAHYVADHVPHAHVHQIPGAGHAALLTHPEALASALIEFFAQAQQSA
ncbi:alpha/beta fold hydrolase [Streptomyces cyaneochromogenes]|uniref:alpha/beta fold hydrolase n=1 Tax=Streptomyces cyaneochromogenes TaxID=2496836 RepID=UPI0015883A57|nr:alpha/beta hydrolase [Streptomyces cyaneochromogenes]